MRDPLPRSSVWLAALLIVTGASTFQPIAASPPTAQALSGPGGAGSGSGLIVPHDRVAVIGSSSTRIGIWVHTLEFLVHTRYPEWNVQFRRFAAGGSTFETGLQQLDAWLAEYHPTVVIFNYGGNDAAAGRDGLGLFKERMAACVAKVRASGSRVILVTPQAADVRRSGREPAARRTLYAETMLDYGRSQGWAVIDVHHPLEALQVHEERRNPHYTILRDGIHLTHPAYVAWGYFFFDRLDLPFVRSEAVLTADGKVVAQENCSIRDVSVEQESLAFTRTDRVLPILPPGHLPPPEFTPLEADSRYLLAVTGLPHGRYEIRCESQLIGLVNAHELAAGVNLNSLILSTGRHAPWDGLARLLWDATDLHRIGNTPWRFVVRRTTVAHDPAIAKPPGQAVGTATTPTSGNPADERK